MSTFLGTTLRVKVWKERSCEGLVTILRETLSITFFLLFYLGWRVLELIPKVEEPKIGYRVLETNL